MKVQSTKRVMPDRQS